MDDINNYFWITKDNIKLRMLDMDIKHIQAAHTHACEKEYEYFYKQNIFNSLREKLEEVAEARNITLKHPDERFPSKKWGKYFCAMREVKKVVPEAQKEAKEPVLASNLKQIDTL